MNEEIYILEAANYYREAPQFSVVGAFSSLSLAEIYLKTRRTLRGEDMILDPKYKNARFTKEKDGEFYRFKFSDDGVITSYRIKGYKIFNSKNDLPLSKTLTKSRGIKKEYFFKDNKTHIKIEEI